MWMIALWAILIPLLAIAAGWLRPRRDVFLLLVYAQSIIYIDIAPTLASSDVNAAMQARYVWVQAFVLGLFQLPLILLYCATMRRRRRRYGDERTFDVSRWRLATFVVVCTLHGIAYFVIAAKYGLLYRRVADELPTIQLSMSLVELAIYRSFIELGPFLIAAQLVLLRTHPPMSRGVAWTSRAGLAITTLLFLAYAMVNSRLYSIMVIAMLLGVVSVTSSGERRLRPTTILAIMIAGLGCLYVIRVVNGVRASFASGRSLASLDNFLPFSSARSSTPDDEYRWRLNGVDLIAMIADNVEAQGPAMGSAWAVPFILSLDPIVKTPFTTEAKRASLTTAKTWLLLRYAGVSKADYYSCMLSDAYGNFAVFGFLFAAAIVGVVLATATAALRWSSAPAALLFAIFALERILPFEQGLETILFGWLKLVPFVIAFLLIFPLRRSHHQTQALSFEV